MITGRYDFSFSRGSFTVRHSRSLRNSDNGDGDVLLGLGMFDEIHNHYAPLGEEFMCICQTKDIEDCGGCMNTYFLSSNGELFIVDYSGTADWVIDEDRRTPFHDAFKIVRSGKNGRVKPAYLTRSITIYPAVRDDHADKRWIEASVKIVNGKVTDHEVSVKAIPSRF